MSIYKITKGKDQPVARGTGFWVDGFGHVSIEWVKDENFTSEYDKELVLDAMYKATKRLIRLVDREQ